MAFRVAQHGSVCRCLGRGAAIRHGTGEPSHGIFGSTGADCCCTGSGREVAGVGCVVSMAASSVAARSFYSFAKASSRFLSSFREM